MTLAATDTKPWYRQLWPWVLIAIPGSSMIYCAIFITMALTSESSMVSDDYYKDGLAINQTLERDEQAHRMGLSAEYLSDGHSVLDVRVAGSEALTTNTLILRLIHPTIDDRDQLVRLSHVRGDRFQARLPEPLEGRWYLDLRDATNEWRLYGAGFFAPRQPVTIDAAARSR